MRDEMRGDERRGGGVEEERSWDAFKRRTHTSESGGDNKTCHPISITTDKNVY